MLPPFPQPLAVAPRWGPSDLALPRLPGDNGRVIEVTEPQVWVLIAVSAASIFSMIGIVSVSFTRTVTSAISAVEGRISGLEGRIGGLEGKVDAQLTGLRETMDARFDAIDAKFTGKFELLDRDIQALSKRVFGAE